jgi:hypothetical protein
LYLSIFISGQTVMRLITLALLPLLAACVTPREACIANAGSDLRVINSLIGTTRGNLARGFANETQQKIREVNTTCATELPDGTIIRTECEKVAVREVKVPVAIDLNAEHAKLSSLEERQRQLQINAEAVRQQCIAANPE